ncbi:MAG: DUF1801 domain-containing protein [Bacteroidota bacterium]|nr:DUF1801 domain-containing protein [Bacteroidota bacterium]
MNQDVTKYINRSKQWKDELIVIREILLDAGLTEEYKWAAPCYTYNAKNVLMVQPFKEYFALGFFNGAALTDPKGLLVKPGEHTRFGRQLKLTDSQDIVKKAAIIKKFIKEAITKDASTPIKAEATPVIEVEELKAVFKKNAALKKAFESLTPGRQRGYLIFFSAAKQSETRFARIEKYTNQILCGKGITDCTCGLSKRMPICDGSHKLLNKN